MTYSRVTSLSIFALAVIMLIGAVVMQLVWLIPAAFVVMGAGVLLFLGAEEGYDRGDLVTVAGVYALVAGGLAAMVALI